jgi:hypothetical protein
MAFVARLGNEDHAVAWRHLDMDVAQIDVGEGLFGFQLEACGAAPGNDAMNRLGENSVVPVDGFRGSIRAEDQSAPAD